MAGGMSAQEAMALLKGKKKLEEEERERKELEEARRRIEEARLAGVSCPTRYIFHHPDKKEILHSFVPGWREHQ